MNEYVSTIFLLYESISLLVAKPLYCSNCQSVTLPSIMTEPVPLPIGLRSGKGKNPSERNQPVKLAGQQIFGTIKASPEKSQAKTGPSVCVPHISDNRELSTEIGNHLSIA